MHKLGLLILSVMILFSGCNKLDFNLAKNTNVSIYSDDDNSENADIARKVINSINLNGTSITLPITVSDFYSSIDGIVTDCDSFEKLLNEPVALGQQESIMFRIKHNPISITAVNNQDNQITLGECIITEMRINSSISVKYDNDLTNRSRIKECKEQLSSFYESSYTFLDEDKPSDAYICENTLENTEIDGKHYSNQFQVISKTGATRPLEFRIYYKLYSE